MVKSTIIAAFTDRTYNYKIKPPPTSWFIKKVIGKDKLGNLTKHRTIANMPIQYVYEIAKIKREMDEDLAQLSLEMICKMIIGQCSTMGVDIVPGDPSQKAKPFKINLK